MTLDLTAFTVTLASPLGLKCAARFSGDSLLYRAEVESVELSPSVFVSVIYTDYGNSEMLTLNKYVTCIPR